MPRTSPPSSRFRPRRALLTSVMALVALVGSMTIAAATHGGATSYTGCLDVDKGTIRFVTEGDQPLYRCGRGEVVIHLDAGDEDAQPPIECDEGLVPIYESGEWYCGEGEPSGSAGPVWSSDIIDGEVRTQDLADGAVTSDKLADGSVNTWHIVDGGVMNKDLADDAVTSDKIEDGEVKNPDLATDAVTTDKIADGAVTNTDLGTDAVTSDKIADGAVANTDLGSDAVTSDKIADGSVTSPDIRDGDVQTVDLADGAVTGDKISWGSIIAEHLVPGIIQAWHLALDIISGEHVVDGSLTGDDVADGSLTGDDIADGSIGAADLAPGALSLQAGAATSWYPFGAQTVPVADGAWAMVAEVAWQDPAAAANDGTYVASPRNVMLSAQTQLTYLGCVHRFTGDPCPAEDDAAEVLWRLTWRENGYWQTGPEYRSLLSPDDPTVAAPASMLVHVLPDGAGVVQAALEVLVQPADDYHPYDWTVEAASGVVSLVDLGAAVQPPASSP